jgi:hypothetical protein
LLNTYNGLPYWDSFPWRGTVAETLCHENMSCFYSDSKTDLKLLCDYCINFQLFEGTQDAFSRLTAVYRMILPHNSYNIPQHYERHVCGPSYSCKHLFFLDISDFWALVLSELNGYSMALKTFLVNNQCSFHMPVMIFQSTVHSSASSKQSELCLLPY